MFNIWWFMKQKKEAGLSYYGTIDVLSKARGYLAATTVGNYALFGGGYDGSTYFNAVDVYTA